MSDHVSIGMYPPPSHPGYGGFVRRTALRNPRNSWPEPSMMQPARKGT